MKKIFRIFLKILKWGIIVFFGFYLVLFTMIGVKVPEANTGRYAYYWSGFKALWNEHQKFGFAKDLMMPSGFDGFDGPYIVGDSLYYIDANNILKSSKFNPQDTLTVKVNNEYSDSFQINILEKHQVDTDEYELPKKMIAISDIEGNFNGFDSFLRNNKIIDDNYNWIFGDGHLVLVGDFVDRGKNVTQVLWLIYKLEQEARLHDGMVHFILGNHEVMNIHGFWRHNDRKYCKASQKISGLNAWDEATEFMFSNKTELGKWLRTKNVIEKIGDYIFVHAGLHPEIVDYKLSLADINNLTRDGFGVKFSSISDKTSPLKFLKNGETGPYWYRGLIEGNEVTPKINREQLDKVLKYYQSEKIVVGHTVVEDISTDYSGKVIRIDLRHGKIKGSGITKGLLVENGVEFKIDDLGNKQKL